MDITKFILENDSHCYLVEGDIWSSLKSGWQAVLASHGDMPVVTDFATNPDFRQIYGEVRYNHFLLQKELREQGEAVATSELLVHHASKVDQVNSRLLYSLIARRDLEDYQNELRNRGTNALLFSLYSSYAEAINRYRSSSAQALLFVFPGSVDIVIVNNGMVEGFQSLSGIGAGQLAGAGADISINALADSIVTQERIARLRLSGLRVFEMLGEDAGWPERLAQKTGLPLHQVATQNVVVDGELKTSSLLPLLKKVSTQTALSPLERRAEHTCRRFMPLVTCLLLAACGGLFWFNQTTQLSIEQQITRNQTLQSQIQARQQIPVVEPVSYQGELEAIQSVLRSGTQPSYYQLLNRVTLASQVDNPITYDVIEMSYPAAEDPDVKLTLVGFIDSGWNSPLAAFDKLSANFTGQGFKIGDSALDVVEGGLNFAYQLILPACTDHEGCAHAD